MLSHFAWASQSGYRSVPVAGLSVSDAVTSCDRVVACEGVTLDVNEVVDSCVGLHVDVSPEVTV